VKATTYSTPPGVKAVPPLCSSPSIPFHGGDAVTQSFESMYANCSAKRLTAEHEGGALGAGIYAHATS
jgi:hypothetical protein